ncbi:ABC transporter permease [Rhizobiales bacterium]|uniref:ABC transporter permease n=1 Tax=Hongsoonwoonella zoysiae TaxID=2821844 RepID=UPI00156127C9|nr:ABC transporter permease [Hongsoonwoonella zoysiae]NRG17229.1 ABC transporter permease [Hongsoonwoonella zoysiae]
MKADVEPPACPKRGARLRRVLGLGPAGAAVPLIWVLPAVAFMAIFFVAPLVDNVARSLSLAGGFSGAPTSALAAYAKLLGDPYYLEVLVTTLVFSLVVTAISLVAGYPVAYFLVRKSGRYYSLIVFLLVAPLLTSIIMRTFGWRVLLARRGFVNSILMDLGIIDVPINFLSGPGVAVAGLVHVLVPFMVLAIASSLQGIDRQLEESAQILGASRMRTFFHITLPLTLDGIGTGFILVFMLANGSFVTLLLLGGGSIQTLPLLIYQQFTITRDFNLAGAMSNVLLISALICLVLQLRILKRRGVKGK